MAFDELEVRFDLRHDHSELNDFGGRTLQREARPIRRVGMDAMASNQIMTAIAVYIFRDVRTLGVDTPIPRRTPV